MAKPFDKTHIFIAGAGPVGLTAAIELARLGFNPRIVDPNLSVVPESRALAINVRTLDLMEPSGVTEMLLGAGIRIKKLVIRRDRKVLARIDLTLIPHRFNFMLVLAQSKTEEILAAKLAEMGVKLERGLGLESFRPEAPLNLNLSDGSIAKADYLIGADGAHSIVRKTLGLGFAGETDTQVFGLADVTLNDWPFGLDTVVLTILDTHLAPFVPMGEGYGRFISTIGDCLNNLPSDAKVGKVVWETDFKISYRQVSTYQQGNVFLVGDAAHIHSPVGGRGMNLGMEDACWLAWLIAEGRTDEYTKLRHPIGADVLKLTHSFTSFAKSRGVVPDILIRTLLPVVAALPFAQRKILHMLSALDTPPAPWL